MLYCYIYECRISKVPFWNLAYSATWLGLTLAFAHKKHLQSVDVDGVSTDFPNTFSGPFNTYPRLEYPTSLDMSVSLAFFRSLILISILLTLRVAF